MYRNAIIPAGEMKYDALEGSLGVSVCAHGHRRQREVHLHACQHSPYETKFLLAI